MVAVQKRVYNALATDLEAQRARSKSSSSLPSSSTTLLSSSSKFSLLSSSYYYNRLNVFTRAVESNSLKV